MNLSVNCLFPNLYVRSHFPIGPKLAPLAYVTLCMWTFSKGGAYGNDVKNLSEIAKIFAPVSSTAEVMMFWTMTWYVVLFPWRDASMMATVFSSIHSDIGDIHLANWLNSSTKSSLLSVVWDVFWVYGSFSFVTTVCTTSFTSSSVEGALSC